MDMMRSIADDKNEAAIKNKEFEHIPGLGKALDFRDVRLLEKRGAGTNLRFGSYTNKLFSKVT
jgi:hypothetical protein